MNLTDTRIGSGVAVGTMSSGAATWLKLIPDEIGKLGTLAGIILSVTLIIMYVRKIKQESKENTLKIELLQIRIKKYKDPA
jgi:hypothetical protein